MGRNVDPFQLHLLSERYFEGCQKLRKGKSGSMKMNRILKKYEGGNCRISPWRSGVGALYKWESGCKVGS